MLGWLWIGGTALVLGVAGVLADRAAKEKRTRIERDLAERCPELCFTCTWSKYHDLPVPEHHCRPGGEKWDLVPASGNEVAAVGERRE